MMRGWSDPEVWRVVAEQRRELLAELERLGTSDWDEPSLCAGWNVRHVVAHIIMESHYSIWRDWPDLLASGGNLNRFMDEKARRLGAADVPELLGKLRSDIDTQVTPLVSGAIWVLADLLVHRQDIMVPLGRVETIPRAILEQIFAAWDERGFNLGLWVMGLRRRAAGLRLVADDIGWERGDGPLVGGRAQDLLLGLCGRRVGLDRLDGDGVAWLRRRF